MSIENCYNILILGNENVGKTTYINRLITGDFTCEDLVKKTLKISYQKQKKNEVCLFKFIEKQTIDDSIDEICDGCILLFDLTDQTSFDDLETKYKSVKQFDRTIPLVICGNKVDSKSCENKKQEIKMMSRTKKFTTDFLKGESYYDNENGKDVFYYLSSKSNYNFEKPLLHLLRIIEKDGNITLN